MTRIQVDADSFGVRITGLLGHPALVETLVNLVLDPDIQTLAEQVRSDGDEARAQKSGDDDRAYDRALGAFCRAVNGESFTLSRHESEEFADGIGCLLPRRQRAVPSYPEAATR